MAADSPQRHRGAGTDRGTVPGSVITPPTSRAGLRQVPGRHVARVLGSQELRATGGSVALAAFGGINRNRWLAGLPDRFLLPASPRRALSAPRAPTGLSPCCHRQPRGGTHGVMPLGTEEESRHLALTRGLGSWGHVPRGRTGLGLGWHPWVSPPRAIMFPGCCGHPGAAAPSGHPRVIPPRDPGSVLGHLAVPEGSGVWSGIPKGAGIPSRAAGDPSSP